MFNFIECDSQVERGKHDSIAEATKEQITADCKDPSSYLPPVWILDQLSSDDTRQLVIAEDELKTTRKFARIFPTTDTHRYIIL